jgi:hypothetical protein
MAKEKTNQEEHVKEQTDALETNLRFYNQGRTVPANALKPIKAGRLKGMSDINPMWRMKRLTEIFGPVGFGWKYTIDRQWVETYGQDVKVFCNISLFVRDPETKEWSDAIPGVGGSAVVSVESKGPYVNDEAYKMALTDALSIAMKPLGIGADIWYGENATGHNESKYEQYTRTDNSQTTQQNAGTSAVAFTGAQLQQALSELEATDTEQAFQTLWNKWATSVPALCMNGTEFYNKACIKIQQIKNAPK